MAGHAASLCAVTYTYRTRDGGSRHAATCSCNQQITPNMLTHASAGSAQAPQTTQRFGSLSVTVMMTTEHVKTYTSACTGTAALREADLSSRMAVLVMRLQPLMHASAVSIRAQ